ncbi:OmpA family protein [Roseateles sp. P5_E11]
MRAFVLLTPFMLWLMLLASCTSPPKPPTVDESLKRPANSATVVELQGCKHELQNARLLAIESERLAENNAATLSRLAAHQQALVDLQRFQEARGQANSVFTIRFGHGSTRVDIPAHQATPLIDEARAAPLIALRGRTDGAAETPAESRIARERAAAVRDFLISAGVDPAHIRSTYQPVGDHMADNAEASGRAMNRRVEIEIYRALPVSLDAGAPTR